MKIQMGIIFIVLILSVFIITSCSGGAPAKKYETSATTNSAEFKDVEGMEWTLVEITRAGNFAAIDRKKLQEDNMGGFFKIIFDENRVSGVGAPNRYFGPYTLSSNNTLNIGALAGTLMAAFRELEELKEGEYLTLLSAVTRWDLRNGKLLLYCGNDAILGYSKL